MNLTITNSFIKTMQVFGTMPKNSIFLPDTTYQVRLNCKDGGIFVGGNEADHRKSKANDKINVTIIKISKYFGRLGKTDNCIWMQLFFIPNIDVAKEILPQNTVCVAYIKKQSISNLNNLVTDLIVNSDSDPSCGIFSISFVKQISDLGTYYAINFDWRQRKPEEAEHLNVIKEFWNLHHDYLIDVDGTRDMQCIDGLVSTEIQHLINNNNHTLPQHNNGKALAGR